MCDIVPGRGLKKSVNGISALQHLKGRLRDLGFVSVLNMKALTENPINPEEIHRKFYSGKYTRQGSDCNH